MENEKEIKPEETKAPNMVASAAEAATRLKAENERMEANIKKLEELKAYELLGGKTDGKPQETKPEEISPKDYARMALEGKLPIKK